VDPSGLAATLVPFSHHFFRSQPGGIPAEKIRQVNAQARADLLDQQERLRQIYAAHGIPIVVLGRMTTHEEFKQDPSDPFALLRNFRDDGKVNVEILLTAQTALGNMASALGKPRPSNPHGGSIAALGAPKGTSGIVLNPFSLKAYPNLLAHEFTHYALNSGGGDHLCPTGEPRPGEDLMTPAPPHGLSLSPEHVKVLRQTVPFLSSKGWP